MIVNLLLYLAFNLISINATTLNVDQVLSDSFLSVRLYAADCSV